MLTCFDDYLVHQTAEPLAYLATSERNAYGRSWFNGYDPDGEFYFGIALGAYPNRGDEVGSGVLEQFILGPHERCGFKEMLDPA